MLNNWKSRAIAAEGEVATLRAALEHSAQYLQGIEARVADRAALVSIVRDIRKIRFIFVRNGNTVAIEMYGTWDNDVEMWKRMLLDD